MKPGQVTAAVGIGYLLGRTKKMRLAIVLVAASAIAKLGGGRSDGDKGGIADLPEVSDLAARVREDLLGAARSAVAAVATNKIESLNSRLREHTGTTRQRARAEADDELDDELDDTEDTDDQSEVDSDENRDRRAERARPKRHRTAPSTTPGRARSASARRVRR